MMDRMPGVVAERCHKIEKKRGKKCGKGLEIIGNSKIFFSFFFRKKKWFRTMRRNNRAVFPIRTTFNVSSFFPSVFFSLQTPRLTDAIKTDKTRKSFPITGGKVSSRRYSNDFRNSVP